MKCEKDLAFQLAELKELCAMILFLTGEKWQQNGSNQGEHTEIYKINEMYSCVYLNELE